MSVVSSRVSKIELGKDQVASASWMPMVFKTIDGSWSIIVATCVVGTRGWPAGQDHPANIPRPVQMCPVGMPHELRIVRVFSCVARGFKARPSFMFAGC